MPTTSSSFASPALSNWKEGGDDPANTTQKPLNAGWPIWTKIEKESSRFFKRNFLWNRQGKPFIVGEYSSSPTPRSFVFEMDRNGG